jgi:hypothetical protein
MGTLNTRISLRYDTLENWSTASGKATVLNKGEVGVCATTLSGATQPTVMFKVGNGISTFEELPWTSGLAADIYPWAKAKGIEITVEGEGEIITNIAWDETSSSIKITRKTLEATTEAFATRGMIAEQKDGVLVITDAPTKSGIVSVKLI